MPIKVNGKEISENAVQYELQRLVQFYGQHMKPEELQEMLGEMRKRAEEQAIGMELLMQDVQTRSIEIPEAEIDKAVEQMILQAGGEEEYTKIMEQQSLTDDMVRESVRNGRKIDMFIAELTNDIPEPTDSDIKEFFEKDPEQYSNPERKAAQHILVKPNSDSDEDKNTARDALVAIRKQLDDGAEFAALAEKHSHCPSGKKAGGSLGWVTRGMMVPQFEEALFETAVGELSEVIETQFGFHIIQVMEEEDAKPASLEESSDAIRELLVHDTRGKTVAQYVDELKLAADISME